MRIVSVVFDVTDQLLIRFCIRQTLLKNGSVMKKYISYSQTSRKPTIHFGEKYYAIFS
jgi:hypothetical protein